ncbi:hypothetical protein OAN22_00770 [Alphaproteobacteria bacterium]|nr:hypothetical protein [Alphaproteobacteria bacterium]
MATKKDSYHTLLSVYKANAKPCGISPGMKFSPQSGADEACRPALPEEIPRA